MLSVPVTYNVDGKLVKGDVFLSDDASPEQVAAFKEIQDMSRFNITQWEDFQRNYGIDRNGDWQSIKERGILL